MGSNYPAAIDTTSELPDASTMHAQTLGSFPHSDLHGNPNQAIRALEAKVGTTASADTNSIDYKIAALQAAVSALQAVTAVPLVPTGTILLSGSAVAPTGFLLGDGAAVSRTTYSALFALYGTVFGAGDGSTTFNMPNLKDRVPVGAGNLYARGATGGEAAHTLTIPEMPLHDHDSNSLFAFQSGIIDYEIPHTSNGPPYAPIQLSSNTTLPVGGGGAHNNLQPYVAVNYIIKT